MKLKLGGLVRWMSRSTSVMPLVENLTTRHIPVGAGGRNSSSGLQITLFGATGFLGRYLVNDLGRTGNSLIVATRGDDMEWRHLKPLTDYGKMCVKYFHPRDEKSVRDAIRESDVVVNLIGKDYDTLNFTVKQSNEDMAKMIGRVSREEDVKHLVQMSSTALNEKHSGMEKSVWVESKRMAEEGIKEEFPGAVIVRSNILYGEEDKLLNTFCQRLQRWPFVPLVKEGSAVVAPVFVGDLASALGLISTDFSFCNKTFSLSGRHQYTYKQLYEFCAHHIHARPRFVDVPLSMAKAAGRILQQLPSPTVTADTFAMQMISQPTNAPENCLDFGALSMTPAAFENKALNFIYKYKPGGHFTDPKAAHLNVHS